MTAKEVNFSVFCPALKCNVVLFHKTWVEHIIMAHPIMKTRLDAVRKAIQSCRTTADIFHKTKNPHQISIHWKCSDFEPFNRYLRVAVILKEKGKYGIITSAYPVDNLPQKESKRYEH